MACPERNGNTIHFTIPDTYEAAVVVVFHGTTHKQVDLLWGDGTGHTWDSCDPEIEPGTSYTETTQNLSKQELNATVKVYFDGTECGAEPGAPMQPAESAAQLVMNCNSVAPNQIVIAAWMFQTPGGGETVQITVIVEDSIWGET